MDMVLSEKVLNSKLMAIYFRDLCVNFTPPYRDECESVNISRYKTNKKIFDFLSEIDRLKEEDRCDVETLKNDILKIKKLNCIHLETLWYLDVSKLINLTDIIKFYETNECDEIINKIGEDFFENVLEYKPNQSQVREEMLLSYIKVILADVEGKNEINWESVNPKYSLQSKVFSLIGANLAELYNCSDSNYTLERFLNLTNLMELFSKADVDNVAIQIFFYNLISVLLQGMPKNKKNIFQMQEQQQNNVQDKKIYSFYMLISNYCELKGLITQFKTLLLQKTQAINWCNALVYITFFGSSFQDGWIELKQLSEGIVQKAFEHLDMKLLFSAFLIARQCCFEKSKNCFLSYSQWFASTFSKELFTNKKSCDFFFNFLMDLVSFDPAYYSKIHINKLPSVPSDSRFLLTEYVSHVKSHLADLNVSTELGIFENPTEKKAAEFDVENVVEHFKNTNNILNSVFQASIFSKNYYEKKFLQELLSKYEGKNTPRHKLILKLNSLGKIPSSAFNKYKEIQKSFDRLSKKK